MFTKAEAGAKNTASGGGSTITFSVLARQLGNAPAATLANMRIAAWGFVLCFAFVAFLSWRYFLVPVIFSVAILACLNLAA